MIALDLLLKEQSERESFKNHIVGALALHFHFVDKDSMVAREATTAGHVYSYLSALLNESNSTEFQIRIRKLLVDEGFIKPVSHGGIMWFKGLVAKDNTEDLKVAQRVIEQHYKDRHAYRERQRNHARKRYNRDQGQTHGVEGSLCDSQHQTGQSLTEDKGA